LQSPATWGVEKRWAYEGLGIPDVGLFRRRPCGSARLAARPEASACITCAAAG
jgi:hypothetical protein